MLKPDAKEFVEALKRRKIPYLYHATFSAALSAIDHTQGIFCAAHKINPPFPLPPAGEHIDGLVAVYGNHVCLSIRPFWKFIAELTHRTKNSVCLLAVDARIVCCDGVAFSPKLTDNPHLAAAELQKTSLADFEALFVDPHTPVPKENSAKVLVPGGIPTKLVKKILFASEEEMTRAQRTNPGDLGPCECDPSRFPDVARGIEMKENWPETADIVEEYWMRFLGLIE